MSLYVGCLDIATKLAEYTNVRTDLFMAFCSVLNAKESQDISRPYLLLFLVDSGRTHLGFLVRRIGLGHDLPPTERRPRRSCR